MFDLDKYWKQKRVLQTADSLEKGTAVIQDVESIEKNIENDGVNKNTFDGPPRLISNGKSQPGSSKTPDAEFPPSVSRKESFETILINVLSKEKENKTALTTTAKET